MYGFGLVQGMSTTLKHFFKKPITINYPHEKYPVPPRYRGALRLLVEPSDNSLKCVACGLCAKACPHDVIKMTTKVGADGKRELVSYEANMGFCMYCGLCAEACPFEALELGPAYEEGSYTRDGYIINMRMPEMLAPLEGEWQPSGGGTPRR